MEYLVFFVGARSPTPIGGLCAHNQEKNLVFTAKVTDPRRKEYKERPKAGTADSRR